MFSAFSGQVGAAGPCVGLGLGYIETLAQEEPPPWAVLLFSMLSLWFYSSFSNAIPAKEALLQLPPTLVEGKLC